MLIRKILTPSFIPPTFTQMSLLVGLPESCGERGRSFSQPTSSPRLSAMNNRPVGGRGSETQVSNVRTGVGSRKRIRSPCPHTRTLDGARDARHTSFLRHLGVRANEVLNHFLLPKIVHTDAQGLLNHPVQLSD
jgi:hypothetical protein